MQSQKHTVVTLNDLHKQPLSRLLQYRTALCAICVFLFLVGLSSVFGLMFISFRTVDVHFTILALLFFTSIVSLVIFILAHMVYRDVNVLITFKKMFDIQENKNV